LGGVLKYQRTNTKFHYTIHKLTMISTKCWNSHYRSFIFY